MALIVLIAVLITGIMWTLCKAASLADEESEKRFLEDTSTKK